MAFKFDNLTAIGATNAVKVARGTVDHTVEVNLTSTTTTLISAATVVLQGSMKAEDAVTGVHTDPTLADGSTNTRMKTGTFYYRIDGTNYSKTTVAAGAAFADLAGTAYTGKITDTLYGGSVVLVNSSGTVLHWFPMATPQTYASSTLCLAALRAYVPPKNLCKIGYHVIVATGGDFTYGTTPVTGLITYYDEQTSFFNLQSYALDATDIAAQRAMFHVSSKSVPYIRCYLSALTGTGTVGIKYYPGTY